MKAPFKYFPVLALTVISSFAAAANLEVAGVPNFHQVNERVYRGAQPTGDGWRSLAKLGIKTIVDLRLPDEHATQAEKQAVEAAGMRYVNIPMHGVVAPTEESLSRVLALMNSDTVGPVFVHCRRGADRTGTVIAVYRMTHDHWGNSQAMQEAKSHGMSWTQIGMKRYISRYQAPTVTAAADPQPAAATP
jgi:protein tyrosine phosphatase (PTP) superfamily phosphohydrolase (DUF442 family)